MVKVSIIVPVYNVEAYLAKCLDSLVGQSLKEIEILVVNDGSTDGSEAIARQYEAQWENLRVFTKENGGLASARNFGLPLASGEYLAFIDSDDWIEAQTLEVLYAKALEEDADVVVCDINRVDENGVGLSIPQLDTDLGDLKRAHMIGAPGFCNRIFKRSFLDRVKFRFHEGFYYEDLAVHATLIAQAHTVSYVAQSFYQYFVRQGSITQQNQKNDKFLDAIVSVDHLYEDFCLLPNAKDYWEELEYVHINEFLYTASFRLLKYKEYDPYVKKIAKTLSCRFPRWRKNPYYKKRHWKFKVICNLLYGKHLALLRAITKL